VTVQVLTNRKDGSHVVPAPGQCTIDTGNHQGNLVSRDFLFNTLGYTESDVRPLRESEKLGGISSTEEVLVPEGVVHLTWYHNKSTSMFRNMRFLITPHPRCDLVIGATSIEKCKLLLPPNFHLGSGGDRIVYTPVTGT